MSATTKQVRTWRDEDIDGEVLKNHTIAVLGYGNQGRPQALNLRDSGCTVKIGLRDESRKRDQAMADGFEVLSLSDAAAWGSVIQMLVPDQLMAHVYTTYVQPHLKSGKYLGFCHGYAIHTGAITPPDGIGVYPLPPPRRKASVCESTTSKVPAYQPCAVFSDDRTPLTLFDKTRAVALAYLKALGCGRVGIFETTFAEETISNLFAEQVLLCGGLSSLIQATFETLIKNGVSPEVAYISTLREVKLLAELIHARGIHGMREGISPTALYGDLTRGDRVIDNHVKHTLQEVFDDIQSGAFARELSEEFEAGAPTLTAKVLASYHHPIEAAKRSLNRYF